MTVVVPSLKDLPTIPSWIPPLDTGQPNAGDLNDLSTLPKANFAAANQVIPITYGRDRLFGQPFVVHVDDTLGYLYLAYSFCEGQIAGFEKIIIDSSDALATGIAFEGVKNRGFENGDTTGWDVEADQDGTVNATVSQNGLYGLNIPTGTAATATQQSNRLVAPPEGTQLTIKAWAARNTTPDADCLIVIEEAATVGGALSAATVTQVTGGLQGTAGWQELEITYTVPASIAEYTISLQVDATGTTGSWDFDDVSAVIMEGSDEVGIELSAYVGTATQQFDGILDSALTGYTDDLPGLAYIVLRCPAGSTRGFPRLEAIIQGRLVYDPRLDTTRTDITPNGSGAHREGDSTTWEFSQNPTLCFRDMITNYTGWTILDQGVADNADLNDALVSGVARREIGLTFGKPSTVDAWVKGFRTYMGAFLNWEAGDIRVIPNRPDVEAPGAAFSDGAGGSYIDMGYISEFAFGATADFTVEYTVKHSGGTTAVAVVAQQKDASNDGWGTFINEATEDVKFLLEDDLTNQVIVSMTDALPDDGEFHHITFVVDRTNDQILGYVDSVEHSASPFDISSVTGPLDSGTTAFRCFANSVAGERWVDGILDELRVWDDIRTPAEIADNMNNEIADPTSDASLIGYWKFNDGTGQVAQDSSSLANDGTLNGGTSFVVGKAQIIPDGVAMHIGVDDLLKDSLKLKRRSLRSVPNSVAIDYEDSSGTRWFTARTQADSPRVTSGDEARRLSRVSLPGIHNASQAQREATERLNWYLTDLDCTLTLFDEGWQLTHGSIVAVTHPIGLDAKLFRVRQTSAVSGRWTVDMVEYDPAVYSDTVVADPTIPDTNLGDPLNPPTVTNLVLAEELFNYKTGTTGSRVRVTWDATGFPFLSQYLIEGYVGGAKVWQTTTAANNIVSPPVEEIVDALGTPTDYEVRVSVQSPFATGAAAIQNVQIDGKFAIPSDPTGAIVIQTFADEVNLTWVAAVDIDIWRYEVRRGTTSDSWATATSLSFVDGLSYTDTNIPLGTYRYFIKAIDSVKQESTGAATVDVTLSAPTPVAGLFGFEVASEVRLNWAAVTGEFAERYRIAYSDIPETFETTLDVVDTIRFQTKDVPEGTFTFKAYTQDKVGNEAATAATIDIEVTSDAEAFLADTYDFSFRPDTEPDIVANGSLVNLVTWTVRTDELDYYVTNMADSFAVSPTDFVAADPLANYHSTGASTWLSETKDFGLALTGSWNLTHDTTALQGVVDIALELSTDDVTYVSFGGSAKGEYRYARVRITTLASPGTATSFVKNPVMSLKINVVPLEESGESTSSASAGVGDTVNLSREYTALKEITTQPKNTIATGSAVTSIVDNIIVGPNTGVQTDTTNYLDGGDLADLDFGATQDFTIEFMMKHSGGAQGTKVVLGKRTNTSSAGGWNVVFNESAGVLAVRISDGTNENEQNLTTDIIPNDGAWHHVAMTVDRTGDLMRAYVDTVEDTAAGSPWDISLVTGALDAGSNAFRVFANGGGTEIWENGMVDEVRIWDDVRTAGEISTNYQSELDMTQTQTNLIHYWQMNGDVGGAVTTIADRTAGVSADLTDTGAGGCTYIDPGSAGNLIQKINSFDVFIFDTFGQQLSEQFQWKWKAV